ncbi:MAG: 50S ribosomal protein L14e [Candidatus Njordarchaeum guaymaensis]
MVKLIDIGRIVVITRGRRAGKKAVVVDIIDENYVLITGPKELNGVKKRRMNIDHILPLSIKVDINRGASDDEVLEAIRKQGLEETFKEVIKILAYKV